MNTSTHELVNAVKNAVKDFMRIVVKVGTNLLTKKDGSLDMGYIRSLAQELAQLNKAGKQVVLVSSGAIGAGMGKMGIDKRPSSLRDKQALSAVGQPILMSAYDGIFRGFGVTIAQVLLTRQDFDDRTRYLNARDTLLSLLEMGVVPVINENDTVAVEEINFGDNDTLAALVSAKVSADILVILTDVDGLYKGTPHKGELISRVEEITPEIENYASGESSSGKGVGGMQTKLEAAKIASSSGVKMIIANGARPGMITKAAAGENAGTEFVPRKDALEARKCWIAFGAKCRGKIAVDAGAASAIVEKGKSLLPSGILSVHGTFEMGDTVSVVNQDGKEIARGLTYYSLQSVEKIKGKKSSEIKNILGSADYEEVIHRDNLVVL